MGYIYLIQTSDCYSSISDCDVYKIGKTSKENPSKRIDSYRGKAAIIYLTIKVTDEDSAEKELLELFRSKFIIPKDQRGKEYFRGNINEMVMLVLDNIKKYIQKNNDNVLSALVKGNIEDVKKIAKSENIIKIIEYAAEIDRIEIIKSLMDLDIFDPYETVKTLHRNGKNKACNMIINHYKDIEIRYLLSLMANDTKQALEYLKFVKDDNIMEVSKKYCEEKLPAFLENIYTKQ